MFMVLIAIVAVGICVVLAIVLKERYADAKLKAAQLAEEKRLQRQRDQGEEELKRHREQYERDQQDREQKRHFEEERIAAKWKRAHAESELVFLPRLEESFGLLAKTGKFSLIISVLEARQRCYSLQNLQRLFSTHRGSMLATAVKHIRSMKDEGEVKDEMERILLLMQKNKRVEVIQQASIGEADKERLIEEIEAVFSEELANSFRDQAL